MEIAEEEAKLEAQRKGLDKKELKTQPSFGGLEHKGLFLDEKCLRRNTRIRIFLNPRNVP